jgi:glycolate oxidase iron-sulfur subunit
MAPEHAATATPVPQAPAPPGSAPVSTGAFRGPDRPSLDKILDCVHCGFCLPTCPTYLALGNEMDSPRGRIYLMRGAVEGGIPLGEAFARHMDRCLVCRACETACPSGVQFGQLMESSRAGIQQQPQGRRLSDRLLRRLILATFTHRRRLGALLRPLRWYQRSGLQALMRRTPLLARLGRLGVMESLLPPLPPPAAPLPERIPAVGVPRGRVGLLLGCAQEVFFPEVNRATARVLAANGFDVVIPPAQGCCGSLFVHEGEREQGKALARRLIDAFEAAGVDLVAVNAAGCGSVMKASCCTAIPGMRRGGWPSPAGSAMPPSCWPRPGSSARCTP